jgi:Rieske Fe-S protein
MIPKSSLTRRRFVHVVGTVGAGMCAGCIGAGDGSLELLTEDFEVRLSEHPGLAQTDKSVLIDAGTLRPIAVTRTGAEEFVVTGTECNHQHCGVARNGAGWLCPCHGSRFDLDGTKTAGVATADLTNYDWMLDGDVLTVVAP